MQYNTNENIEKIKMLIGFIQGDAKEVLEGLTLTADDDTLDCLWRLCDMIGDYAEEARILIGKMSDEREDMQNA